jgi:hypothetical protein
MIQAAVAALSVLKAGITITEEPFSSAVTYDTKVNNYLHGIMWGLSGNGKLHKFQESSGSMGHGFYYVAHTALDAQLNGGTFWAKGQPWNPAKGLTGKNWSEDLTISDRKIMTLLTKACKALDVKQTWASYFRSKDSFFGNEIKKSLPHKKVGIITAEESTLMGELHKDSIALYNKAIAILSDPQLENLPGLSTTLKGTGQALAPLCLLVDTIVSHRASFIYSSDKKKKKSELKTPVKDLINRMDLERYITAFDPLLIAGMKPFRVQEDLNLDSPKVLSALAESYNKKLQAIKDRRDLRPPITLHQHGVPQLLGHLLSRNNKPLLRPNILAFLMSRPSMQAL